MRSMALCLVLILAASVCRADSDIKKFLVCSGYGTLIGAGLGAASLAVVEDPGSKASNIAKGASLGLYAGIGVGLYLVYRQPEPVKEIDQAFWMEPVVHTAGIEGATLKTFFRF